MDMSLYPHAVAMSADEFMSWSTALINDLISSGTRRTVDKLTGPIWSWAMKNSMHPLHWGLACCALEMAQASAPRFDAERYGMIYRSSPRHLFPQPPDVVTDLLGNPSVNEQDIDLPGG